MNTLDMLQQIRETLYKLLGHDGYLIGDMAIGIYWLKADQLSDEMKKIYLTKPAKDFAKR